MSPRAKVLFLIPSLIAHGAERQLCELVKAMDPARFEVHVAVFYAPEHVAGDDLSPEIQALPHVRFHCLHKTRGLVGNLGLFSRLLALVWRIEPDILHGYMDGNLPALLVGRLLRKRVVWGIRRSVGNLAAADRKNLRHLRWSLRLSRFVHLILFNSEAGLESHRGLGMRGQRMLVVPNGFDTVRFKPDAALGREQREAWGIPGEVPVIGIVGRLNPVKGHETFLRAAAQVKAVHPEARFVCLGDGPSDYRAALESLGATLGLGNSVLWPGATERMPSAYNAMTLLALASTEEGFPNVLGEAMACGVPCVTTRVGDAELLVGAAGVVVAPSDPEALASALLGLLAESFELREARSRTSRERVVASYETPVLARRTERALDQLLSPSSRAALAVE